MVFGYFCCLSLNRSFLGIDLVVGESLIDLMVCSGWKQEFVVDQKKIPSAVYCSTMETGYKNVSNKYSSG